MKTILTKPTEDMIELASKLIIQGEVVGVPTETVYGLAGDSTNPNAIKKIFEAKGRPSDNPLICHISNFEMFKKVAKTIPDDAIALAEAFWPGPLTIIVKKSDYVCAESTANMDSVGVRMPNNKVALEIIEKSGVPFSAPSANLSGKPSPTTAEDVFADMNGKIPLIIDGGETDAGVESTVVSVIDKSPIILRPGVITKEMMEEVLHKEVLIAKGVTEGVEDNKPVLSPGMKYKHYSPSAEVVILNGSLEDFKKYVEKNKQDGTFVLCFDGEAKHFDIPCIEYGKEDDAKAQAHKLFASLRELDKQNAKLVFARCPKTTGVSLAVYNRLIRSAGFKLINL